MPCDKGSLWDVLDEANPVFRAYLFYSAVLVLKVMAMVHLTRVLRFRKKIFISHEDTIGHQDEGAVVSNDDPDIERVRRAHLNDLENIPPFLVAALAYILTDPDPTLAVNLMQLFTGARFAHTFVYAVMVMPRPATAVMFGTGFVVTAYMAMVSAVYFIL